MQSQREDQVEKGQRLLLATLIVGGLGSLARAWLELTGEMGAVNSAAGWIALVGWCGAALVGIHLHRLTNSEQLMAGAIDDERSQALRRRSVHFAFILVLVLQLVLEVAAPLLEARSGVELTASFAASLTFALAVIAALGRYLYLDRHE